MSAFNGVKVFSATMFRQREELGEQVTRWIEEAKRTRPGFRIVDIVTTQSSDSAYHCVSISLFYSEGATPPLPDTRAKRAPRKAGP